MRCSTIQSTKGNKKEKKENKGSKATDVSPESESLEGSVNKNKRKEDGPTA